MIRNIEWCQSAWFREKVQWCSSVLEDSEEESEVEFCNAPNCRTRRMKFLVKQGRGENVRDKLEATGHLQRVELNYLEGSVAARTRKEEQGSMPKGVQERMEGQRDLHLGANVDSMRGMVDFIALALKMALLGQVNDIPNDSPLTVLCGDLYMSVFRWKFSWLWLMALDRGSGKGKRGLWQQLLYPSSMSWY